MRINPHTNLDKKRRSANYSETKSAPPFKCGITGRMPEISVGVNSSIFRSYDIRGIYPSTVNEDSAYLIGRAFVKFLNPKGKTGLNIVVGRDNRLSSVSLFKSLSRGIIDQGVKVIDIGLSTTPMLYWACGFYGYDGGINITASHNPKEHNGFKMVRKGAVPISGKTGLKEIYKLTGKSFARLKKGKVVKKKILRDYLKFNFKDFNFRKLRKLKIIIDTANSVSGIMLSGIKKHLPVKIYSLFEKLDGNFPNHPPDPLIEKNLNSLKEEVKNKKADLGVAFDGDGDRIVFVTEKGEVIPGDLICAFLAELLLVAETLSHLPPRFAARGSAKQNSRAKILYDIRSSRIVKEVIKDNGGQPIVWRIGHSFIKEKMRKENILFGGEFSGHYYLKNHYFSEAPLFVILKITEAISQTGKSLSELIRPYQKYFHSGEINFKIKDKNKALELLEGKYKKGKISKIDGLRIDFKDWWFLARPSGTEDLIRLVIEAENKKLMLNKKKELCRIMNCQNLTLRN